MSRVLTQSPRSKRKIVLTSTGVVTNTTTTTVTDDDIVPRVSIDCRFSALYGNDASTASTSNDILVLNETNVPLFQDMHQFQALISTKLHVNDPNVRLAMFVNPLQAGITDVPDIVPEIASIVLDDSLALDDSRALDDSIVLEKGALTGTIEPRADGLRGVETIEEFNRLVFSFQQHISGTRDNALDHVFATIHDDLKYKHSLRCHGKWVMQMYRRFHLHFLFCELILDFCSLEWYLSWDSKIVGNRIARSYKYRVSHGPSFLHAFQSFVDQSIVRRGSRTECF